LAERDVYVVGSVNVDLVVTADTLPGPGETVAGGTFERHGGGKGANQAVAAARLGARVRMVAAAGADDLGDEAIALLEAEGIDVSAVQRLEARPTGVALIVVDEAGENQIAVASGANAALDAAAVEGALREAGAGVVLLGLEVPDAAVLAGARAARAAGLRIVLNPAPARPLPSELLELSPLLTPNRDEARSLAGEDDAEAAARALGARTHASVVVTLGAEGVLVLDGDTVERIPAPRVEAVDTTGAGDAFNGALACELAGGAALLDAVRSAVAVAAESTLRPGARTVVAPRAPG
jgi:ribokinase